MQVKITDCSYHLLVRIARRCGFLIYEGRKHCKVKSREGKFVTAIPRHNRLKRETARAIVGAFNAHGASIDYL